ncbi:unnamed protein product, partial [Ectocarpus sp. 12 AP-2014]
ELERRRRARRHGGRHRPGGGRGGRCGCGEVPGQDRRRSVEVRDEPRVPAGRVLHGREAGVAPDDPEGQAEVLRAARTGAL